MTPGISGTTIDVEVNGRGETIPAEMTIADLLQLRQIGRQLVAIERNGEIVPKNEFDSIRLEAGDRLEIVHFVGGG